MTITFVKAASCQSCPAWEERMKGFSSQYNFSFKTIDVSNPQNTRWAMEHNIRSVPGAVVDNRYFVFSNPLDVQRFIKIVNE